ncbi:MAG: hypothetical protein HY881_04950 [Deltaproteobacteria bacterium]|nr:hypothetical protein [Deltaproteobacteria bacterium]
MIYYIRRYRLGLRKIRVWLPFVFLPLAIYLLVAAAVPDRFYVTQMLAVQKTAPIALSKTPVDIILMGEMASNPAWLFLDDFAITDLIKYVEMTLHGRKEDATSRNLRGVIENSMSLKTADEAHVLLSYYGHDADMGKMLVNYYTQRLVSRSKDGLIRSTKKLDRANTSENNGPPRIQPVRKDAPDTESTLFPSQSAVPEGDIIVQGHRIFWRSSRLLPAAMILAGSLVLMFILAGFVEWIDPSFKSERQTSRYLDLRIIGVMPNLEPLVLRMKPKGTSQSLFVND